MRPVSSRPALRGGVLALLAAVMFGVSTPLVQHFGTSVGSFTTAALMYAGAALVGALLRQPVEREASVTRRDAPVLALMALFGAVIGPVALAWGLQHTSGASASLMLTMEAVFTAVLARLWYHETLDRRVTLAMMLLTLGAIVLVADRADSGPGQIIGLLAVAIATAAWGVDNTLSRSVAQLDPGQVVMIKATIGTVVSILIARLFNEGTPSLQAAAALLAIGAGGYGLSLRFYLLAQRAFGAARTASVFAFAPFVGALLAFVLGERAGSVWMLAGAISMATGIVLHLAERHAHAHAHDAQEHEHAHEHTDGHHTHSHANMPHGAHSHIHRHEPILHTHAHVPDQHHTHRH